MNYLIVKVNEQLEERTTNNLGRSYRKDASHFNELDYTGASAYVDHEQFPFFLRLQRIFRFNGLTHFVSYLLPILVCFVIYYYAYKALMESWLTLEIEPSSVLSTIVTDTSSTSNAGRLEENEQSHSTVCVVLDIIKFLVSVALSLVLKAMGSFFKDFKKMMQYLEFIRAVFPLMSTKDVFSPEARFLMVSPVLLFGVVLVVLSFISSFFIPFTRLFIAGVCALIVMLSSMILIFPLVLQSFVEGIPLVEIGLVIQSGYLYMGKANFWMTVVVVILVVDHFLPPLVPKRGEEDEMNSARVLDYEFEHPLS